MIKAGAPHLDFEMWERSTPSTHSGSPVPFRPVFFVGPGWSRTAGMVCIYLFRKIINTLISTSAVPASVRAVTVSAAKKYPSPTATIGLTYA